MPTAPLRATVLLALLAASAASAQPQADASQPQADASPPTGPAPHLDPHAMPTAYVGGQWWMGDHFEPRDTVWADGGAFVPGPLADAERVVDLAGRYVVPPFGDAHTHMLSSAWSTWIAEPYVDQGTFYALVLTDEAERANAVRAEFEGPGTMDVAYAHGGFTSAGSHPGPTYEMIALGYYDGRPVTRAMFDEAVESRLNLGDAYWNVDTVADLDDAWPRFLAQRPDAVKVYLTDVAAGLAVGDMAGHGLHPDVLRAVVARADAAGLPVWAHVDTGADAALAVAAGVDGLAHLPGYGYGADDPVATYTVPDSTIAAMAERGVAIVPTVALTETRTGGRPARLTLARDLQRRQVRRMLAADVPVAIGADMFGSTVRPEADYLERHGFADRATLLDLWTRVTPRAVFPGRAIGRLADGFEASLLALACDPTADWSCTAQIAHREKQGVDLDADDTADAWRRLDVDAFTAPASPTDGPLLAGLKALTRGDLDAATDRLTTALAAAPDSLRPFVRRRLAETAAERFDWAEAVRQRAAAGDDIAEGTVAGFARFPAARMRLDAPETVVPLDGVRVPAAVNGVPVRAIVDTGAQTTSVPRALVERLGLRVDTTARGRSVVPSMGLAFDTYAVLLDSVTVGEATFTNVPATVAWRDDEGAGGNLTDGDEIFLGAALLRHLADGLRYDYAGSTFAILRDLPETDARPQFVIEPSTGAPALAVRVDGERAVGVVDTGNAAPVYLADGALDLADVPMSRALSGDGWSIQLYSRAFEIPGHPDGTHEAYEAGYIFDADHPVDAILGTTVWADGALTLDFVNRRVRFEPAPTSP